MKSLIKLNKETITSLELLEQINFFRKQERKPETNHADLLVIIETEFANINRKRVEGGVRPETLDLIKLELTKENIYMAEYKHPQNGQIYPMYILPISKAKQALLKESKFVRKAVIGILEEIEKNLIPTLQEELKTKNRIIDLLRKNSLESENVRISKVQVSQNCGTNLLHIPAPWKRAMSITDNDNYVKMKFDQSKKIITIEKV